MQKSFDFLIDQEFLFQCFTDYFINCMVSSYQALASEEGKLADA